MKLTTYITTLLLIAIANLHSQEISLEQLEVPFAPGERLLRFSVQDQIQSEFYIFYATDRNQLAHLSLNNTNDAVSFGKAIKFEGNRPNESKLEFVFPGTSTPKGPNTFHYLELERLSNRQFKGASYLSPHDRVKASNRSGLFGNDFTTDTNEKVYRKECVFFRVLEVNNYANISRMSKIEDFYMPDDFTIGLAGDSFAAGTGADRNPTNPCYRSQKSGQVKAVKKFIQNYPSISVSYLHTACNGAKTTDLYRIHQNENENIQFTMIENWLSQNDFDELSLLIMNIGGNNVDFADLVKYYYVFPGNFVGSQDQGLMPERFNALNISYDNLELAIQDKFPLASVAITTLPKVTRNTQNEFCCDNLLDYSEYACAYNRHISSAIGNPPGEFQAVENDILMPLNRTIRRKGAQHNWDIIDVQNNANNNGLCVCADNGGYFWTFLGGVGQFDVNFTSHPNEAGYRNIYRDDIENYIVNKYDYMSERYHLRLAFGNADIPECSSFIQLYIQRLEVAGKIDVSALSAINKRGSATSIKRDFLKNIKTSSNPKALLQKEQQKQQVLNKKYRASVQRQLAQSKVKLPKSTLSQRIKDLQDSPEYKKWLLAKSEKEKNLIYKKLALKVNETSSATKKTIKKGKLKQ